MMRLYSIRFSHYNEKARWALDYYEVPYVEIPMMPVLHFAVTPWLLGFRGKADSQSSPFSTPILKTDEGRVLPKSSDILEYLSHRYGKKNSLFPNEESKKLEEYYNKYLGPHTRRVFYYHIFQEPKELFWLAEKNVPKSQAYLYRALFPGLKMVMNRMGIDLKQKEKSLGYIYKEFEKVEKTLSDGRPYLTGDKFSAADLSFACLGGAMILPQPSEGFGGQLPTYESKCIELVKLSKEFRKSCVGEWVLKLFREKRGKRVIPCHPELQ